LIAKRICNGQGRDPRRIGEFDHLAVTAGESLKLWEFATIGRDAFLGDPALHD
jgi:hypothetical protein